ncbi:MAG: ATP-binding cassette domain-containing protein [Candidatus Puniceispirillaceae bacterium]
MTLELHNLCLSWPDRLLLHDFSMTMKAGEIALIQGPSGCGKSTLLSAIAGTYEPHLSISGTIVLDSTPLNEVPTHKRQIAILFQESLLFPHLNVAENLGFGLPAGLTRAKRQSAITNALEAASLSGYGDKDPAHLSGGQKARIAMMRAMLSAPRALLMDESFGSLDPELRSQFGHFVSQQIKERQIPALLISHHETDKAFATGQLIDWPSI